MPGAAPQEFLLCSFFGVLKIYSRLKLSSVHVNPNVVSCFVLCTLLHAHFQSNELTPVASDSLYSGLDWIGLDWIETLILPGKAFSHEATLQDTQDTHIHVQITHNTVNQFVNQSNQFVNRSLSAAVDGKGMPLFPLLLEVSPCHPISFDPQS